jgi:hypothetical protein
MTPSNKEAASAELKQVIASAYAKNELWTTDWSKKELERFAYRFDLLDTRTSDEPHCSLKQPALPQLKRKSDPYVILCSINLCSGF